jgi:hypothetical protein
MKAHHDDVQKFIRNKIFRQPRENILASLLIFRAMKNPSRGGR